jgi:hypothetical protein
VGPASAASTVTTSNWTTQFDHRFGLHFDFSENVTMDVNLNAKNLLEFDNLSVQLIIGL